MRKILLMSLITILTIVLTHGLALAITGQCSNCHTMHNSQAGVGVVQTYANGVITTGGSTPQNQLLVASCIACHAGSTGQTNSFSAPIVVHTTAPAGQGASYTLAGGDFYWVATGLGATDARGHNVSGLAVGDVAIGYSYPPALIRVQLLALPLEQVGSTWNSSNQLSCDGTYGCHGMHSSSGITGAHHGNTGLTSNRCNVADTIGNSYRFLGNIFGLERSDWNWAETAVNHNEYYGVNDTSLRSQSNTAYANTNTISFSCAECHGYFHSRIDNTSLGSPWLRHPTDVDLPAMVEVSVYNPDTLTCYSVEAPVARPTVPVSSGSTVTPGTDIVMCLSCHRAHGSPYADILRWDYTTMQAATGTGDTGCFTCHTTKNAD